MSSAIAQTVNANPPAYQDLFRVNLRLGVTVYEIACMHCHSLTWAPVVAGLIQPKIYFCNHCGKEVLTLQPAESGTPIKSTFVAEVKL